MGGKLMENNQIATETIRAISYKTIPVLILAYLLCFLDRTNIGYASLTMNGQLGFTPSIFGFGAGIFFIGYFLFEVPSNIMLTKVGARIWFARIMITWGAISACNSLIWNETSFYTIRFFLGVAEAGFFPGVIFYLSCWLPKAFRARVIGIFIVSVPLSVIIGGPVSGLILQYMEGVYGLHGWQWLFICEGAPTILLGIFVLFWLTNKPEDANWLSEPQRRWLIEKLASERTLENATNASFLETISDGRVWAMALIYFGNSASLNGIGLWMPQIVKAFGGLTILQISLITMIPYLASAVGMVLLTRSSDRLNDRKWHVVGALLAGSVGLVGSGLTGNPIVSIAFISIAATGILSAFPVFWAVPLRMFRDTSSAIAIAVIGGVGNLGGFIGPYLVGWIREATGSFQIALGALAACGVIAALVMALLSESPAKPKLDAAGAAV
jgi:ACS family tartrate transporter-like MFS transporter